MKIGFLNNQIDVRATWQTYLYAKYARIFLGHSTAIYYPATAYHTFVRARQNPWFDLRIRTTRFTARTKAKLKTCYDPKIAERITRDGISVIEIGLDTDFGHLDAVHHVKSGENDGFLPRGTNYWVHAVFDASQKHGERYVAVSQWLGRKHNVPFVPHIVEVADDQQDLRKQLGIPPDAVVFGRFGGLDTFDVPWAWEAIENALTRFKNVYFLFANTDTKQQHDRIISLPTIYDGQVSLEVQKRRFINTCNAMLHARIRGETFGIAVGEFALCGKPVLTYGKSPELAHIEMLRCPLLYNDAAELEHWIERAAAGDLPKEDGGAYLDCTPKKVMAVFDRQFIR
jgi:hypothetical protein